MHLYRSCELCAVGHCGAIFIAVRVSCVQSMLSQCVVLCNIVLYNLLLDFVLMLLDDEPTSGCAVVIACSLQFIVSLCAQTDVCLLL